MEQFVTINFASPVALPRGQVDKTLVLSQYPDAAAVRDGDRLLVGWYASPTGQVVPQKHGQARRAWRQYGPAPIMWADPGPGSAFPDALALLMKPGAGEDGTVAEAPTALQAQAQKAKETAKAERDQAAKVDAEHAEIERRTNGRHRPGRPVEGNQEST